MDKKKLIYSFFQKILEPENIKPEIFLSPKLIKMLDTVNNDLYNVIDTILLKYENTENPQLLSCIVELLDAHDYHFTYRVTANTPKAITDRYDLHEDTLASTIDFKKSCVIIGDVEKKVETTDVLYKRWIAFGKPKSIMYNPLKYNSNIFGYIVSISNELNFFSDKDSEQAKMIAGLINAAFVDIFNALQQYVVLAEKEMLLEAGETKVKLIQECTGLVFKNIKEAILLFDLNNTIIDCNESAENMFNSKYDDIVGKTLDCILGLKNKKVLRCMNNAIMQEQEWRDTITINLPESVLYYDVIMNPIKRDDLSSIGVMILAKDVTSQTFKLEVFKDAIDQLDDLIVIGIEKPEAQIVFVNKAFEKFTGYTKEDMIGASPCALMGQKSEPEIVQSISEALSNGLIYEDDIITYKKDGNPYWCHLVIKPIANGAEEYFVAKNKPLDRKVV